MKSRRLIFDDDFYRLGAVLLSDKFAALELKLMDTFKKLDFPIPTGGFANNIEYTKWKRAVAKQGKGNLPRKSLEKIVSEFKLDDKNAGYYVGLFWKIYLGKRFGEDFAGIKAPISLRWGGTCKLGEAIITVYPWTKKEDFISLWPNLKQQITTKSNYRAKEKFKTSFERDFRLYMLYKKRMQEKKSGKLVIDTEGPKSLIFYIFDDPETKLIFNKFGAIGAVSEMKKIINYFNKLLKGISIE